MRPRRTGSVAAIALAAVGTMILIGSRTAAVEAVYPVEHAAHAVRIGLWPRFVGLFRGSAAYAENVRLRREVAGLSLLKGDVERLAAENARLRKALGYVVREPGGWLAAGVLSRGGAAAGARDVLRVDKGTLAGVREGAVVTVPEGLVGQVIAVTPHTSEVLLATDPSLRVACEIETGDPRGVRGILSGGSGDVLLVRHLAGRTAAAGARVITSGRGGVFPRGFAVGEVLSVAEGGREAEIRPQVDYAALEDVFIRLEK